MAGSRSHSENKLWENRPNIILASTDISDVPILALIFLGSIPCVYFLYIRY